MLPTEICYDKSNLPTYLVAVDSWGAIFHPCPFKIGWIKWESKLHSNDMP